MNLCTYIANNSDLSVEKNILFKIFSRSSSPYLALFSFTAPLFMI